MTCGGTLKRDGRTRSKNLLPRFLPPTLATSTQGYPTSTSTPTSINTQPVGVEDLVLLRASGWCCLSIACSSSIDIDLWERIVAGGESLGSIFTPANPSRCSGDALTQRSQH
eukprot:3219635-Rhodomonas_salina.2